MAAERCARGGRNKPAPHFQTKSRISASGAEGSTTRSKIWNALTGRVPLSRYLELPGLVIPLIYVLREASAEGEGVPRWAEVGGHGLWFYYHEEHQVPHVAVRGEHRATVRLEDGDVLAGHLPAKLHRSVRRLLAEHRDEAYAAWEATRRQEPPDRLS